MESPFTIICNDINVSNMVLLLSYSLRRKKDRLKSIHVTSLSEQQ
jgi:hypothetical protein